MLYHFFDWLTREEIRFPGSGLFQFITFRVMLALILSLVITTVYGKRIIGFLQPLVRCRQREPEPVSIVNGLNHVNAPPAKCPSCSGMPWTTAPRITPWAKLARIEPRRQP